jgi:hypothetical protein
MGRRVKKGVTCMFLQLSQKIIKIDHGFRVGKVDKKAQRIRNYIERKTGRIL